MLQLYDFLQKKDLFISLSFKKLTQFGPFPPSISFHVSTYKCITIDLTSIFSVIFKKLSFKNCAKINRCKMYLALWIYTCMVRPTDQKMVTTERIVNDSQFPRGRVRPALQGCKGENAELGFRQREGVESICKKPFLRFLKEGMGEARYVVKQF